MYKVLTDITRSMAPLKHWSHTASFIATHSTASLPEVLCSPPEVCRTVDKLEKVSFYSFFQFVEADSASFQKQHVTVSHAHDLHLFKELTVSV